MANAIIAINFATLTDIQAGDSSTTSVNPVTLKSALQSGTDLFPLNVANTTINGALDVTNRINTAGRITATSSITGLNIAIGKTAVIGAAGTLTTTSNISAGGNIVFNNTGGNIVGTNAVGTRWINTAAPTTQGSNGDIWYQIA
jgi:hypothetical protein